MISAIEVPVSVPPMTGLIPVPVVHAALLIVPLAEYARLLPHVRAALSTDVPLPDAPNVGLTVVVLLALSLRHFTATMVRVDPESL